MKTSEIFKSKRVLSFEIFPPKRTAPVNTIYNTVEELKGLAPDFISVTYGAGGSKNNTETLKIASAIKNDYGIDSVAHLPCINLTKEDVLKMIKDLKTAGIENILALRGDVNPDYTPKNDFKYASDLVSFIKENGDFNVIGACYPEGHIECPSIEQDIKNLKIKVEAGAEHLITQLFFDNKYFYPFREQVAKAGINVPIEAGIMPVMSKKQVEKMVALNGVKLPDKVVSIITKYENDNDSIREAGIEYAIEQINDLVKNGVDGIHLYTMNSPYIAHKIYEAINPLFISK